MFEIMLKLLFFYRKKLLNISFDRRIYLIATEILIFIGIGCVFFSVAVFLLVKKLRSQLESAATEEKRMYLNIRNNIMGNNIMGAKNKSLKQANNAIKQKQEVFDEKATVQEMRKKMKDAKNTLAKAKKQCNEAVNKVKKMMKKNLKNAEILTIAGGNTGLSDLDSLGSFDASSLDSSDDFLQDSFESYLPDSSNDFLISKDTINSVQNNIHL